MMVALHLNLYTETIISISAEKFAVIAG